MSQFVNSRIKKSNRDLFILLCIEFFLLILFAKAAWEENFESSTMTFAVVISVAFVITLIMYIGRKIKRENHPALESLQSFGQIEDVVAEIEKEYDRSENKRKICNCYV